MSKNKLIIDIKSVENAPNKKIEVNFEDFIEGIKSKNKIKANLAGFSLDDFIEIKGKISGTAILECDLCLKKFEYKLNFNIEEMFAKNALQEEYGLETEIKEGQFVQDLNGQQEIDVYDLLYQSVILNFPNKKVCGINCKGGDIFIRDENRPQNEPDPRMSVFKDIKINESRKK